MMRSIVLNHNRFGLIVTELNTTDFKNQTFTTKIRGANTISSLSLQNGNMTNGGASIFLPDSLISKCPRNAVVRISYNAFLTSVLFQADPSSAFGHLITAGNLSASQMILSASACKGSLIEGLVDPVIIEFPKPQVSTSNFFSYDINIPRSIFAVLETHQSLYVYFGIQT